MVKRTILGRSGEEKVVDLLKDLTERASAGNTRPAGIKILEDDEDFFWSRGDGTDHSMREVDEGLAAAEGRILDAEASLGETQVRLEDAERLVDQTQIRLDEIDETTLPAVREELEAAAAQAAADLAILDGKLVTANTELAEAKADLEQLGVDLGAEADARAQLATEVQGTFDELDTRLADFATDASLGPIRDALTTAQSAVEAAQTIAETANAAANAASQAALEAAGIANSKGRVLIQATEPTGADRQAANIWIKPAVDDPATEVKETATTYVYIVESDTWVPTTSDELAQAAQNALDAREAAQQASQRAETAITNAAAAQSAAEAAQRTADQSTLDAADAWNAAVAANEAADRIRTDLASAPSVWDDPSFEYGWGGLDDMSNFSGRIDRTQDWAASGEWSVRYTASGAGVNNYGKYVWVPVTQGHWYSMSATVYSPTHEQSWGGTWQTYDKYNGTATTLINTPTLTVGPGETLSDTMFFQVPAGSSYVRFWAGQRAAYNKAEHTGQVVYLDDFRMADVTDIYPQLQAAQAAAAVAQDAADAAMLEAEKKLDQGQVQSIANASQAAAEATARSLTEAAESRAAQEALRVAKAEAAREAGEAEAAAKAYADLIDTGASSADIEAAKRYAEEQAEEARVAAEAAAAADATAKTEAAEARAAADAKSKADKALADAKADASSKAAAAENAAKSAAAADAASKAAAAEASAKTAAAADAKSKADKALADAKVDAKTKADAAQAAAIADAAAKDATLKAQAAADAKTKADKALSDALAALATARGQITAEIKASANGKNAITISTSEPSGSGVVVGDTWWRTDTAGNIFGQWVWNGSIWGPRQIRSEVIANLDVHKLQVTGDASMDSAVIDKLWVDGLVGKSAIFQQINVAAGNILTDPNGLNPALRNTVGGAAWVWDNTGKYWKRPAVQGGTTQYNAYINAGSGYDSNLLEAGAMYVLSWDLWVDKVAANTGARASIYYRRLDGSTAFVGDGTEAGGDYDGTDAVTPGQWTRVERFWRAPADASSGGFNFQLINGASDSTEVRIRRPFVGKQAATVMIEDGAVSAQKVNAESVGAAVGQFVEANVGKLVADTTVTDTAVIDKLWVDGIVGKQATFQNLTVASGNLLPNGDFSQGLEHWRKDFDWSVTNLASPQVSGGNATAVTSSAGTATSSWTGPSFKMVGGQRYVFECWIRADKNGSRFFFELRDQTNAHVVTDGVILEGGSGAVGSYAMSSYLVPIAWTKYRMEFTAAAGVKEVRPSGIYFNHPNGSVTDAQVWLTGIRIAPKDGVVHIEDGQISTSKLNVTGEMSAAIVNSMSVNTKKLVVTQEAVLAHATLLGQTVVDDINVQGKLIGTGGVFTGTVDFANVNVTGTQLVNKLGANSITADKVSGGSFEGKTFTGGLFAGAEFQAPASPRWNGGIAIDPTNGLRAWNSSGTQTVSIDPAKGDLRMGAGIYLTGSDRNGLVLNPPSAIGTASIYFSAGEDLGANSAAIWRIGYSTGKAPLMLRGGNGEGITVKGANNTFDGNMAVGGTTILGGETRQLGNLVFPSPPSTSQTANVYMNPTNGVIARSTSSARYKKSIEDWSPDPETVVQMVPRKWQAIDPAPGDGPDDWFVGMVAEEVDELGLTELVGYDEQGRPDSLHYPIIAVAQQAVIRKHEADLVELRERIALLEQKMEAQ